MVEPYRFSRSGSFANRDEFLALLREGVRAFLGEFSSEIWLWDAWEPDGRTVTIGWTHTSRMQFHIGEDSWNCDATIDPWHPHCIPRPEARFDRAFAAILEDA